MSYTSQYTGAEIDAGIEAAHAAVPRSGSAMTGPLLLHDAPTDEKGAATKKYVDDAESSAKSYTDSKAETTLADAKTYADAQDATILSEAKAYADDEAASSLSTAKSYAYGIAHAAETAANEYTDSKIPTSLPNPNALTFTGAVSGTYDGSSAVVVNIPTVEDIIAALPDASGVEY